MGLFVLLKLPLTVGNMVMIIKTLNTANKSVWDDYVERHPQGRLYHKTVWAEIFSETSGKEPVYLFAEQEGKITGIAPLVKFTSPLTGKVLISLPFVNYGGLLYDNEISKNALIEKITALQKEGAFSSVELRTAEADAYDLPVKENKVTFILDLPKTAEALNKQFKAKLRSQIRRPSKEGMYAKIGGAELLEDFYFVFCRNMRDLGTPVTGKYFFRKLLDVFPQKARVVTVYTNENVPAASAFLLGYKETLEIPWASSLRKYNRFSPNMLLYWKVLSYAIEAGYEKFDFGRGTKDGGTHKFKKQWGGEEKALYWYYLLPAGEELPQVNKENPKYALAIRIWQKMPLALANFIGPKVAKFLP